MRSRLRSLWAMALVLVACDEVTGPTVHMVEEPFSIALAAAGVANGTIAIFGLDLQIITRTRNQLTGRLGSGQGVIFLHTGNGRITVRGN